MPHSWSQIFSSSSHRGSASMTSSADDDLSRRLSRTSAAVAPHHASGRRYSESCARRTCVLIGEARASSPPARKKPPQRTRSNTYLHKTRSLVVSPPPPSALIPANLRNRRPVYNLHDHCEEPRFVLGNHLQQPPPQQQRNFGLFKSFRRSKGRNRKPVTNSSVAAAAASDVIKPNVTTTNTRLPLFRSASMFALEHARSEDLVPARVEDLIVRCLKYFDPSTGKCTDNDFPKKFFIAHMWFTTSEEVMKIFHNLFLEKTTDGEVKKKICLAVGFWLREFPQMFLLDAALNHALKNLQSSARSDNYVDIKTIELNSESDFGKIQRLQMSKRPNDTNKKLRKYSLVFNHLKAQELAIHISYLEHKCFRRLTVADYLEYAKRGSIKGILKLERAVILCNNITHWVQCLVLENRSPTERATAIAKFVEIAEKLQEMNNFNTLRAIVGALEHTAIARLHKTMGVVPKETMRTLERFVELLDSKANYSKYRRAYAQISGQFKVPILAIVLKDLIAVQAANPDRLDGSKINVKKMYMIGGIFEELIGMQRAAFPFDINTDLVNAVRSALYLEYSEDEIYKLSEEREPRQSRANGSLSPNGNKMSFENIGFADFARYTCQLDTNTMRQHVTNIVNSVFKAYDLDCDGFISEEEFESFARNFQGLDNFATVDEDKDGFISMEEMMDYFLKITSTSTRKHEVFQNFQHDFFETTYFHLTYCEQCGKMLWGLVKQGWKCRVCGINCHKSCKSRIVVECRAKENREVQDKKKKKKSTSKSVTSAGSLPKTEAVLLTQVEDDAFEATSPTSSFISSHSGDSEMIGGNRSISPFCPQTPLTATKFSNSKLYPLNEDLSSLPSSCESLTTADDPKTAIESKIFVFDMCENNEKKDDELPTKNSDTEPATKVVVTPIKRRIAEKRHNQRPRSSTVSLINEKSTSSSSSLDSKPTMYRCDSGVSGCSSSASWSAPPTPATAEHSYDGCKFLYPPVIQPCGGGNNSSRLTPTSSDEAVRHHDLATTTPPQRHPTEGQLQFEKNKIAPNLINGFKGKLKIRIENDEKEVDENT